MNYSLCIYDQSLRLCDVRITDNLQINYWRGCRRKRLSAGHFFDIIQNNHTSFYAKPMNSISRNICSNSGPFERRRRLSTDCRNESVNVCFFTTHVRYTDLISQFPDRQKRGTERKTYPEDRSRYM